MNNHSLPDRLVRNLLMAIIAVLFASCHTVRYRVPDVSMSRIERKLGIVPDRKDYLPLYQAAAEWVGTPYRYGGNSPRGIDCSGLVCAIYNDVYRIGLKRSSEDMMNENCRKVSKKHLREGDLVFFSTSGRRKKIDHVGIFLKDGYFVHTSTSRGVIVSHLEEPYYQKTWRSAGRVSR